MRRMWSCADPLAVSLGDPAGIGSEIALEAWRRRKKERLPAFFLVGNAAFLKRRAAALRGRESRNSPRSLRRLQRFLKPRSLFGIRGGVLERGLESPTLRALKKRAARSIWRQILCSQAKPPRSSPILSTKRGFTKRASAIRGRPNIFRRARSARL